MRGINKTILVGTVGKDPETRSFPDGGMVANISLATSESWKDKQTGQAVENTEWHRVVLRDRGNFKLGQIAAQYVKKGSKLYIEGKLQTRSYDKDGQKHYVTEIIASELQMLDSRNDSQQAPQAATSPVAQAQAQPQGGGYEFMDDIPFNRLDSMFSI